MKRTPALILILTVFCSGLLHASNLDTIGVTVLRVVTTNLNGAGIRVAQPEAIESLGTTNFEVNPDVPGQPASLFTYISSSGSTNTFPNTVGGGSGHAGGVAGNFYGMSGGAATNVAHVDNYDADYFVQVGEVVVGPVTNYIVTLPATNINDPVVNQSFVFLNEDYSHISTNEEEAVNSAYDDYAAQYRTLFVSGAGNGGPVSPPATCYNGLGVGVSDGGSSYGPTLDNGRCKPDLIAPGGATSFSTPYVSGAAAVLMQAGRRGDGGSDTNSAADIRTVKALLLNGAVKPSDWTNQAPSPLDLRYGAGVLNVFNSYEQLAGGKRGYIASTTVSTGGAHPPNGAAGTVGVLNGWDFNTNTSSGFPFPSDAIHHYFFNVTNADSSATFTAAATLVWERHQSQTAINNLALFLYNAANSNLVACSTSLVDNVQHVFVPRLAAGRYDLQVWKAGGNSIVSASEPYALAWSFVSETLAAAKSGTNLVLSWPVYPDGFHVEATASLTTPNWSSNNIPPAVFINHQHVLMIGATNGPQFFRLRTP
jgi:hypothetical protein